MASEPNSALTWLARSETNSTINTSDTRDHVLIDEFNGHWPLLGMGAIGEGSKN